MTQNFLDHPLGRHLLSCTRCLHVNLNISLLVFAVLTLYLTVTAFTGLNPELNVYYEYEPINVMVISGCACALVITSFLGIYSSIALSRDGFLGNSIILVLLIVGTTGYSVWRTIMHDYSKTSKLFKQLDDDIDKYGLHEDLIDTIQRTFSCCGAEGFMDWVQGIPLSCCQEADNAKNEAAADCNEDNPLLNKKGCFDSMAEMLMYYNWIILISIGLLNSIQTVVVTLSYILCRAVQGTRKKDTLEAPEPKSEPEPEPELEPQPEPTPEPEAVPEPETAPETAIVPPPPPPPPLPEPIKVEAPNPILT